MGELPRSCLSNLRANVETLPFLTRGNQWDMNRVSEFNLSAAFEQLPVLPGAQRLVRDLKRSGAKLWVVSAAGTGFPRTDRLRIQQLHTVFGDVFEDILVIPLGASKKEFIAGIAQNSLLIDDSTKHVLAHKDAGRDAIWMNFRGLSEFPGIDSICNLDEIYNLLPQLTSTLRTVATCA